MNSITHKPLSLREMEDRLDAIESDPETLGLMLSAWYQLNVVLDASDLTAPKVGLALRKARFCLGKLEAILEARELAPSSRRRRMVASRSATAP